MIGIRFDLNMKWRGRIEDKEISMKGNWSVCSNWCGGE